MSRHIHHRILCTIALLLMVCVVSRAQERLYDNTHSERLDSVIRLNEQHQYFDAYRCALRLNRDIEAAMQQSGVAPEALADADFERIYWPTKKSLAETAYMLGNHVVMLQASGQMTAALNGRHTKRTNRMRATLQSDIAKIDGSRLYLTEQFDSSHVSLLRALQLRPVYSNEDRDFVWKVRDELVQLYYRQARYDQALQQIDTILASKHGNRQEETSEMRDDRMQVLSQRALCLAQTGNYKEALRVIKDVEKYYSTRDQRRYAEYLRRHAKILMLQYEATGRYNAEALTCYRRYLDLARQYVDANFVAMTDAEREQYWMAEHPFVTDCYRLEDHDPALLYNVALFSKAVLLQVGRTFRPDMNAAERRAALASVRVQWPQVKASMPDSSAAIEYICYDRGGQSQLAALVLTKKSNAPQFIHIAAVDSIKQHNVGGDANRVTVSQALSTTNKQELINQLYGDSLLRLKIWNEALQSAIADCKDVYFAADGITHQLAVEYLLPPALEGKQLYRLTSTRMLTEKRTGVRTDQMLMCGDVEYEHSISEDGAQPDGASNDELAYSLHSATGGTLPHLMNSRAEVDSVRVLRSSDSDVVLYADSVTESAVRNLLGRHHVALFSTHGMFADATTAGTDLRPATTDQQLSQSCLFMAGAQANMQNSQFDSSHLDGILSAREVAGMHLDSLDLVVMSACMTGLGYITPDGVFGLQRAWKAAGVKAIVAALWSVDDQSTGIFIRLLYANLESGMSLHEAFTAARQALMTEQFPIRYSSGRIRHKTFNAPYYTNAFILIDGLE